MDAFDFASDCTQVNFQTDDIFGSEDCLYLNVYAPAEAIDQATSGNFSVFVYIMGEAFQSGSSKHYGPDFLIEKDVIVVSRTVNAFKYLYVKRQMSMIEGIGICVVFDRSHSTID